MKSLFYFINIDADQEYVTCEKMPSTASQLRPPTTAHTCLALTMYQAQF